MTSPAVPAPTVAPDRRAALKARHRSAILAAARELVDERGGPQFTVDELAERADVARRTIFNHFASLDEVLLRLCGDALDVLIDDFVATVAAAPVGEGTRASLFDDIASSIRSTDLPGAIASITIVFGPPDPDDPRGRALSDEAFARVAARLLDEVVPRNPGVDRLEAEILVGSLINGIIVVAGHWVRSTGIRLDDEGRDAWQGLLTTMIESVRSGYRPTS
ncbi:TetR/AcrR family transcriptional regulator [Frondihabitans cladoniiphilus]|uniref:HTH tetR-type domain-containing protein n=1 Tax=Frondihabitans cladoniiphilus TaxID=715785 RepID=A0ABP8VHK3_9MICO